MSSSVNDFISLKIRNISTLSIILVLTIHSQNIYNRITGFEPNNWNYFIQTFIYDGVSRIAVPLFFIISAFFYFGNDQNLFNSYFLIIGKKIKTILVPYIVISILSYVLFIIIQAIPYARLFFNNQLLIYNNFTEIFVTIFFKPLAYQLWFLRNLFLLFVIAPVILFLTKKIPYFYILFLLTSWVCLNDYIPFYILESLTFFSFGCYLKIHKFNFVNRIYISSCKLIWFYSILWIFLIASYILTDNTSIKRLSVIIGLICTWELFSTKYVNYFFKHRYMLMFSKFTFFIFLIHEPFLTIFIKSSFFLFSKSNFVSLILFFISPFIVSFFSILIGSLIKKQSPRIYEIITGGR